MVRINHVEARRRRQYAKPAIVHEVLLETRAGTPMMEEDPLLFEGLLPTHWLLPPRPPRA